ncbi:MAG: type II toxin-antitoxin system VapC family toxin [Pseudomonadota bacterium]|nr:type II toxin-antitoxin system VapC family toxin [Pseudomonadota bacterium]
MGNQFVVDNSVVMAWCFADEENDYADFVLGSLEDKVAIVPAIWPLEIGNVLVAAERRKRLSEADSVRFLSLVKNLPISVEQETPNRMMKEILAIARYHQLSTYDASYLDLAMRRDLPLATQDASLMRAADRSQVPIFEKSGT